MAGHSKWAGIKHKKAIVDARRGKLFTKLARAITVAAKEGGGDVEGNPSLALAVQKAKDASMPKDNIERAIAKGTGEGADADALEAVMYEGYGPGGVAMLVEALTDNRNRTGSEMRHIFTKNGGNLGEPGSVAYLFDKKGVVVIDGERYTEDDLMVAIDAGAEDIAMDDDVFEVLSEPADLTAVRAALDGGGRRDRERRRSPSGRRRSSRSTRTARPSVLRLIDALEDQDDVDDGARELRRRRRDPRAGRWLTGRSGVPAAHAVSVEPGGDHARGADGARQRRHVARRAARAHLRWPPSSPTRRNPSMGPYLLRADRPAGRDGGGREGPRRAEPRRTSG